MRCVTCQLLDFADESALQRLVRHQAAQIDTLHNRLLHGDDRKIYERRIRELEETVERLNRRPR